MNIAWYNSLHKMFFKYLIKALKSWQIFLAICGFPSFISGIAIIFFPESPKFLMSKGRNEEALQVFQTIFKINSGGSASDYPVNILFCFEY